MNFATEIKAQSARAWRSYVTHCNRCPVCSSIEITVDVARCAIGKVLDDAWWSLYLLTRDANRAAGAALVVATIGGER